MRIPKAAKRLKEIANMEKSVLLPGSQKALALGEEALIRVKLLRTPTNYPISKLLPGETEE